MHVTRPVSRNFDPSRILSPRTRGEVSWTDFNRSFHRLQHLEWWKVNRNTKENPASFRDGVRYSREDIFDVPTDASFDIGIDWGLLEHFPGKTKAQLLRKMRDFIRPGGFQISSVPRNSFGNRLFYRAFADEVNFGYRELMDLEEFQSTIEMCGNKVIESWGMMDSHVIISEKSL